MNTRLRGKMMLADGTRYEGLLTGAAAHAEWTGPVWGEVVFNTSMTGYQEVITDPSYAGQIVVMTYPQIGNYGVTSEDSENAGPVPRAPWWCANCRSSFRPGPAASARAVHGRLGSPRPHRGRHPRGDAARALMGAVVAAIGRPRRTTRTRNSRAQETGPRPAARGRRVRNAGRQTAVRGTGGPPSSTSESRRACSTPSAARSDDARLRLVVRRRSDPVGPVRIRAPFQRARRPGGRRAGGGQRPAARRPGFRCSVSASATS